MHCVQLGALLVYFWVDLKGGCSDLVDPLALCELEYPTLVYKVRGALEVWSQNRGVCLIFEFVWHLSSFVGFVASGLRSPMCVAPSLC